MNLELLAQVILFCLLIVAAYTDITAGKVYNWCTFPALFSGLVINYWIGGIREGEPNLILSLTGMAVAGGVYLIFYAARVMGGGDLKLMVAVGALKGFPFILWAIFYTSLMGAVLGLLHLLWRGRLLAGLRGSLKMTVRFNRKDMTQAELDDTAAAREKVPYGVAIAVGTIWALYATRVHP